MITTISKKTTNLTFFVLQDITIDNNIVGNYFAYPTHNCQMCTICNIQYFFKESVTKESLLSLLQAIKKENRATILMDLCDNIKPIIDNLFPKESIILESPYLNTTDNNMIIYIINISIAINYLNR